MLLGRLDPFVTFASGAKIRVGLSASHLTADLPDGAHGVSRFAIDAALTGGHAGLWGEVLRQYGETVTDFRTPASRHRDHACDTRRFSTRNAYILAGGNTRSAA
jgi:hypothetical protein